MSRALDMLAVQLQQLRELNEAARHIGEDAIRERRSLHQVRDEIAYRLRFLAESLHPNDPDNETARQRQQTLLEKLEYYERHDTDLETRVTDMEDTSKRLMLLIRQLELAGTQLTRTQSKTGELSPTTSADPWQIALRAQLIERGRKENVSRPCSRNS